MGVKFLFVLNEPMVKQ